LEQATDICQGLETMDDYLRRGAHGLDNQQIISSTKLKKN
jgi:hypothetical protein